MDKEFNTLQALMTIISLLWGLLSVVGGGFIYLFWQRITKLENVVDAVQKDMNGMRLNYLDRFDDLKETIKTFELKITERIAKLEAVIKNDSTNIEG